MKSNYKLKLTAVAFVLGVGVGHANASQTTNSLTTTSVTQNSDNWELVKEENGIKIFVSQYENVDGTLAIKIKFENTTNNNRSVSWVLINRNSKIVLSENINEIKAMDSFIYMNEINPIPVYYGETLNDLSITIK